MYNPIEKFLNLRFIQLTSAGLDRVPLEYINEHAISLYNASGVYSIPMAEFALGGILQFYKQSRFFVENQKNHQWKKHRGLLELTGKRVCIIGCGDVGQEIAKRLKAFECYIVGLNRTIHRIPYFDEVLPLDKIEETVENSDILICSIALTPETKGIISREIIDYFSTEMVLVNVSRGAVIDEAALIDWLQIGGYAVLDVFEEEPLQENSPLWEMDNVILTPHNSFVGDGNRERLRKLIYDHLMVL